MISIKYLVVFFISAFAMAETVAPTQPNVQGHVVVQYLNQTVHLGGDFEVLIAAPFPKSSPEEVDAINQVKKSAIVEWLRLKGKVQFEKTLTDRLVDEYIMTFSKKRMGEKEDQLQVKGDIAVGLINDALHVSAATQDDQFQMKPAFHLSTNVSSLNLSTDHPLYKTLFSGTQAILQKYRFKLGAADTKRIAMARPLVSPNFVDKLKGSIGAGFNSLIWMDLATCSNCGNSQYKLDMYLYNLSSGRVEIAESQDLTMNATDFNYADKLKNGLKAAMLAFAQTFEDRISSGRMMSQSYFLIFKSVRNASQYAWITRMLSNRTLFTRTQYKQGDVNTKEFEIYTTLTKEELIDRLRNELNAQPGLRVSIR